MRAFSSAALSSSVRTLAEMQKYAADLRSLTQGRGVFSMEFDHYDTVPAHIAGGIIEAHKKEMEAKKEE